MPSSTFLNLPNAKRERILNKCYEEFTNHTYQVASVSRIVEELGVSKGSMYKYFTNKKDLYMYLINIAAQTKLKHLRSCMNDTESNFFDTLWAVVKTGVDFDLNYKQYSLFLGRVSTDTEVLLQVPVTRQLVEKSSLFIRDMVLVAQGRGDIRSDISADLITYIINTTILNYASMVCKRQEVDHNELLTTLSNGSNEIDKDQVLKELKDLLEMIKDGIVKK